MAKNVTDLNMFYSLGDGNLFMAMQAGFVRVLPRFACVHTHEGYTPKTSNGGDALLLDPK